MTDEGWLVLRGKAKVQAREVLTVQTTVKEITATAENDELFEALRKLRGDIARKRGVPAYVIFSDSTLHDMCRKLPTTDDEFMRVNGVGDTKLNLYGGQFIQVIKKYTPENI